MLRDSRRDLGIRSSCRARSATRHRICLHRPSLVVCVFSVLIGAIGAAVRVFVCGLAGSHVPLRSQHRQHHRSIPCAAEDTDAELVDAAQVAPEDFYVVLGVPSDANITGIKAAYRTAVRTVHPDLFQDPEEREVAKVRFERICTAYTTLSSPERRNAYDLRGLAGLALLDFRGEKIITPPKWQVRVAHTGHHFWKRKEWFIGFVLETLFLPAEDIEAAYTEATKDPPGVGQAVLVDQITEKKANDIVDSFSDYGLICLAEEMEEEEIEGAMKS